MGRCIVTAEIHRSGPLEVTVTDAYMAGKRANGFDIPPPLPELARRMQRWKLSLHDVKADDTSQRVGRSYFKAISGHRDAGSTACPGIRLYRQIRTIRRLAVRWQQNGTTTAPAPTAPVSPQTAPSAR